MAPAKNVLLALSVFITAGACGDDGVSDGGVDSSLDAPGDADASDSDAGVDAGPMPPGLCAICRRDTDCSEGALCLVLEGGERGCGIPCDETADCADVGVDAECAEEVPGLPMQCRPSSGTCITVPVATPCDSDAECGGRFDRCVDAEGLGGVCTSGCSVDADCPILAHRCREVGGSSSACIPDEVPAAERCRRLIDVGGAEECSADGDCASGTCLELPGGAGVCATPAPCVAGPEIAPGLCAPSAPSDGPAAELVADCSCYAAEDRGSLFDEAIGELGRDRCDLHWPTSVMNLLIPAITHDPFRLSFTDRILGDWSSAVPFAERVGEGLDEASVGEAIAMGGAWADMGALSAEPYVGDDLTEALATLLEATGATPDRTGIATQVSGLSADLASRLAPIVVAVREALVAREAAVARLGDDIERYYDGASGLFIGGGLVGLDLRRSDQKGALLGDVDVALMAEAAARLAATVEAADLGSLPADAES